MDGWTNKKQATLTYSFLNRDFVVVSDRVLPKEVKLDHIFLAIQLWVQIDMLHAQWAATHSVCCFSFLFLIACSQSKLSQEEKVREDIKISMNEETWISTRSLGNQNQNPLNSLWWQSISLQGLGILDSALLLLPL